MSAAIHLQALSFLLLGLSVCSVWTPSILIGRRRLAPWLVFFIGAAVSALASGVINWLALIALASMLAICSVSQTVEGAALRAGFTALAMLFAIALALHLVPGFNNPTVVAGVRISPDAAQFTQYASFDKAAAGLLLLVFYCQRAVTRAEWHALLAPTVTAIVGTVLAVTLLGFSLGYVRPDLKLPPFTPAFLATNLLFTCVAEEAFFRGLLQERLARAFPANGQWRWAPVAISSASFGVAHLAGGPLLVVLATIGGIGYSLAYAATRRIEAAVVTHFAVNAVHFLGFTYPHLQR